VPNAKEFLDGKIPMDAFRGSLYPMVLGIFGFVLSDFFYAGRHGNSNPFSSTGCLCDI
jgi:hypothetical protein